MRSASPEHAGISHATDPQSRPRRVTPPLTDLDTTPLPCKHFGVSESPNKANLTPAELRAIEDHKYFLSQRLGREATIEEAIHDFVTNVRPAWLRDKLRHDNLHQRSVMEWYRFCEQMERGRDLGRHGGAEEWIPRYAGMWRTWRESLEQNDFVTITVVARNPTVFHMRPSGDLASLASQFDCDVYLHKDGMPIHNFKLHGRPYVHVKSIILMLSVGISDGDTLEFIALGREASQALSAIKKFVEDLGE